MSPTHSHGLIPSLPPICLFTEACSLTKLSIPLTGKSTRWFGNLRHFASPFFFFPTTREHSPCEYPSCARIRYYPEALVTFPLSHANSKSPGQSAAFPIKSTENSSTHTGEEYEFFGLDLHPEFSQAFRVAQT